MLTDQDIAEAKRALKELADEAQGNGNSEGWIAAQERPIRAVIAAHEAKAAPAVPDADELESALERLVERCNTDQFLCNDDAVIHAEATLERIYKLRKSTATPAAPSQPVNRPQNCGTSFCSCIECVCEPEPVTLTELLRQGFAVLMAKAYSEEWFDGLSSIDGLYEFLVAEGERIPDDTTIGGTIEAIIAALREKEGK